MRKQSFVAVLLTIAGLLSLTGDLAHAGKDEKKVAVCHLPPGNPANAHTITVGEAAVNAHLVHGDELGECPTGCSSDAACEDGNACTADTCADGGLCLHDSVDCDDTNACTTDSCDPGSGCVWSPNDGVACDDGNDCTASDMCAGTACQGTAITGCCDADTDCLDQDPCTTDACNGNHECTNVPKGCTAPDECSIGACDADGNCVTTPVSCDDSDPCTIDNCDPNDGCTNDPIPECNSEPFCGNGSIDLGEECDSTLNPDPDCDVVHPGCQGECACLPPLHDLECLCVAVNDV